jgi:hypothetical protein
MLAAWGVAIGALWRHDGPRGCAAKGWVGIVDIGEQSNKHNGTSLLV